MDVERLAWNAVDAARGAAERLVRVRGQEWRVETSPALIAAAFAAIEHVRVDGRAPDVWAPFSGFFAARDGWVRLHGNYPHHAAAITAALGARDRAELETGLTAYEARAVEEAVRAAGGIAVAVRTPAEWARHPHGRATAGDPWVSVAVGAARPRVRGGRLPMSGVRVLDLTRVIAGPACSQLLACLGADVLRIDPPDRPELLDQYLSNGMGKRSAELDLNRARGCLESLLPQADIVLVGYRPGALARFGLAPEDLAERHPHLIVGSLSAWGEHGAWGDRPGFDSIVQAACGIATRCADAVRAGGRPGALPVQALDHATGYLLAAHVLTLLADARAGVVRISLLGAARTLLAYAPPPRPDRMPSLPVPLAEVASPAGRLLAVPPPLTLDGATIELPVSGYGQALLAWESASTAYE